MNRWLHNLIDVIIQGKNIGEDYWFYHKWKDVPSKELGIYHRIERHDDYKKITKSLRAHGISINVDNPLDFLMSISFSKFPEDFNLEELEIVGLTHEVFDYVWSSLTRDQRLYWAEAFKDIIVNPSRYFKNKILYPEDLELYEFQNLINYIKDKKIEELI